MHADTSAGRHQPVGQLDGAMTADALTETARDRSVDRIIRAEVDLDRAAETGLTTLFAVAYTRVRV
jgi:hypothetical protein